MINPNRKRIAPGTFAAVIRAYLQDEVFTSKRPSTQRGYRIYLAQAEHVLGELDVNEISCVHVQRFIKGFAGKPGAQGQALTAIKALVAWAVPDERLPVDMPYQLKTVKTLKSDGGHVAWTEEQIALGLAHCSPQMQRYIAMQSGTGQRGSDVVKMMWSEIRTNKFGRLGVMVKQLKTFRKTRMEYHVPFTPELEAAIATWPRPTAQEMLDDPNKRFICLKKDGKPWTRPQVTSCWNHFESRRHPELKGLTLHGLRAAAVIRLLKAGANPSQVTWCVGMTVQMVARYSRSAAQEEHAEGAISFLDAKAARKREAV